MAVLLIDLDNCITSPRQPIAQEMTQLLLSVLEKHSIGITTGSHLSYLQSQIGTLSHKNLYLLPVNGTQKYEYCQEAGVWKKTYEKNMSEYVDMNALQASLHALSFLKEFTPIGEQVQLRESAINLCPIGRGADSAQRQRFVDYDSKTNFRQNLLPELNALLKKFDCVAVFGGQTSFDIYPIGWDKSHSLKHFPANIFIGDALHANGNDSCMLPHLPCIHVRDCHDTLQVLKSLLL